MKKIIFILFLFVSSFIISQEKFSKEISFITDNDLYVSVVRDRYYTSGIFLSYKYLSKNKKESLEKKILEWQLRQEMYTPYKSTITNILQHDRPFAGYLYGSYGVNRIYKNEQIFNTSVQFGVIGPNAFAKEVQQFIHDIYGFKKAEGWQYQIKNSLALNFNTKYIKPIFKSKNNSFDLFWKNDLNLGTVYTNASSGFYSRIGFKPLKKITNSIAFNTNLNNEQNNTFREIESFFYINPMIKYVVYDATIQGSFLNKTSLVTKDVMPFVFDIEFGIKFTAKRFNFGYAFIYNTSESKDLRYTYGHKYGTISINYLLR
ncbi:lipid A deacylase LpxR family protein [Polaribacter sp. Z022]|uniref:lipid A deacylase LpxR family protein n=1 Tax=Polaribacter sp. Z022 TaxID=2927125 RepID=UPI0020224B23|nr:lipid A deacylase LpxR family protein [Polaribacter sp. Z022]MCL7754413.1 lipid A deacylase LpxR family protein [Polaribacter sp. Z022]